MRHRCAAPRPGASAHRARPGHASPDQPSGRPSRRPGAVAASCALTLLALAGCSMEVDMTITTGGTYDAVLEMRDTTGTVLTSTEDCTALEDPEALDVPQGAQVSAEPLSGGDDEVGCRVTITGVSIPQASQAEEGTMVVRDGDVYTVTMTAPDLGGASSGSDPSLAPSQAPGGDGSFSSLVDARVSVTFPGAVTEADGGSVSGSTVTWDDADALVEGVTASGYAEESRGVPWWSRPTTWVIAVLVVAGTVLGLLAAARHRRAQQPGQPRARRRRGRRDRSSQQGRGRARQARAGASGKERGDQPGRKDQPGRGNQPGRGDQPGRGGRRRLRLWPRRH